jgi:hypothetical protein
MAASSSINFTSAGDFDKYVRSGNIIVLAPGKLYTRSYRHPDLTDPPLLKHFHAHDHFVQITGIVMKKGVPHYANFAVLRDEEFDRVEMETVAGLPPRSRTMTYRRPVRDSHHPDLYAVDARYKGKLFRTSGAITVNGKRLRTGITYGDSESYQWRLWRGSPILAYEPSSDY